jgi:hypothetical protein
MARSAQSATASGLIRHVLSAASLSSSPSALFWLTVVLAVFTLVAAGVGILAWRSAVVRKRLLLSIISRTRLLVAPHIYLADQLRSGFFPQDAVGHINVREGTGVLGTPAGSSVVACRCRRSCRRASRNGLAGESANWLFPVGIGGLVDSRPTRSGWIRIPRYD